jgi:hypothetical protein
MKRFSNDTALDLAEILAEKQKIDEKIEKLELNKKRRNEKKNKTK